jgi:hypothetical protein
MKENREDCIRLGGDFNGRTGEREARNWEEEKWNGKRKSKDKVENAEGKRLMEWIQENGWIVNEEAWERVEEIRIGEKTISK